MPKRVKNPNARWTDKPGHKQRNYEARGTTDNRVQFALYQRQSLHDDMDFSCGIAYIPRNGSRLTLARYNGPSHRHGDISYHAHIHRATAEAIAAGRKPESHADETDRCTTLNGAFRCLIDDFRVVGVSAPPGEEPRLPL